MARFKQGQRHGRRLEMDSCLCLSGKTAVVTGGGGDIGGASSMALAGAGSSSEPTSIGYCRALIQGADLEAIQATIPNHRLGRPEDVAAAVLFFASPAADWITGECMDVNGGQYID